MREELPRPYSSEEVKVTWFQMGSTKILRPDSMNVPFLLKILAYCGE